MKRIAVLIFAAIFCLALFSSIASARQGGGGHPGGRPPSGGHHSGGHYYGHGSHHHGGWYGGWGVGYYPYAYWWGPRIYAYPSWWWPYPYTYSYPYTYPYPSYQPPARVIEQPPAYSEPEQRQPHYWYYCQNPQGYYPYIKSCPGGWMRVVPEGTPSNP